MVVSTRDPETTTARAGVLEFLLVNHPLDCPVCDKGGECPLQDFSYSFGRAWSRMDFPRRVFDGEGVKADVDFGPTLMLNRNRCILCTRCVRFMREIDGDAQIGIVDRGNGSEIATFREQGVHSLLSGNLIQASPIPFVLMLNDLHLLEAPDSHDVLSLVISGDSSTSVNPSDASLMYATRPQTASPRLGECGRIAAMDASWRCRPVAWWSEWPAEASTDRPRAVLRAGRR